MSMPRAYHGAVFVDGAVEERRMCVAGGLGADGEPIASTECYIIAEDRWESKDALASPRARFAMFVLKQSP